MQGVEFLDPNTLISISGLKVGDQIEIPGESISAAVRRLWDQGILGDAKIEIEKVEGRYIFLTFNLKERPRLSKFTFKGIKKGQASDLREKISLISGRVVTDALVKNTQKIIEEHYVDKGFLNAKANIVQRDDSLLDNSVILIINVDKGKKVKIDHINFEGNELLSDKQASLPYERYQTPKRVSVSIKLLNLYLHNTKSDKQRIISLYNKKGYRDAEIVSDSVYDINNKRSRYRH